MNKIEKKINSMIFDNGIFIDEYKNNKIFNNLIDSKEITKYFSEDEIKNIIKDKLKEANNFLNYIYISTFFMFALIFSNLLNGDVFIIQISIILVIGYNILMKNYKKLFFSYLQLLLGIFVIVLPIKNYYNEKKEIVYTQSYSFEKDLVIPNNRNDLIYNKTTNEIYDVKYFNNQNNNCNNINYKKVFKDNEDFLKNKIKKEYFEFKCD